MKLNEGVYEGVWRGKKEYEGVWRLMKVYEYGVPFVSKLIF